MNQPNQIQITIPKGENIAAAVQTAKNASAENGGAKVSFEFNGLLFSVDAQTRSERVCEVYAGVHALLREINGNVERIVVRRMADMDPPEATLIDLKQAILSSLSERLDRVLGADLRARANAVAGLLEPTRT